MINYVRVCININIDTSTTFTIVLCGSLLAVCQLDPCEANVLEMHPLTRFDRS